MSDLVTLAFQNLTAPAVLFFGLGAAAGFLKSDLAVPEQVAKGLSLYLLLAIGFKGGVAAQSQGFTAEFMALVGLGLALGVAMPFIAFALLKTFAPSVDRATLAATAAHYGSISIVTFVAAMDFAKLAGLKPGDYLAAVAAVMETPGIIAALFLAGSPSPSAQSASAGGHKPGLSPELFKEVMLNGSVVLLIGAFVIGLVTGDRGMARLDIFVNGLFAGVLCLFLLEMGLVAARRLMGKNRLSWGLAAAGVLTPLIGAGLALAGCMALGVEAANGAIMMTLAASASYIAAPAAVRIALPEADPGVYLPLSLGVTFPFNIAIGIPLYMGLAQALL